MKYSGAPPGEPLSSVRAFLPTLAFACLFPSALPGQEPDPTAIVRAAIDHWRGESSCSEMTMIIHRPDRERRMSMRAWTEGEENSLVRVTAPPQDVGNGTLLDGEEMWTYSPRVNRVNKVPSSMMSQGWMGSDFSNKDVSRANDIVEEYDHRLLERCAGDGHEAFVIEATPKEHAAVVWGCGLLARIRHRLRGFSLVHCSTSGFSSLGNTPGIPLATKTRWTNNDLTENSANR